MKMFATVIVGACCSMGAQAQESTSRVALMQAESRADYVLEGRLGMSSGAQGSGDECFTESASASSPDEAKRGAKTAVVKAFALALDGVDLNIVKESFRSDNSKNIANDGTKEIREINQMGDVGVFSYGGFALPPVRFPDIALSQTASFGEDGQAPKQLNTAVARGCMERGAMKQAQFRLVLVKLRALREAAEHEADMRVKIAAVTELRMKLMLIRSQFSDDTFISALNVFEKNLVLPLEGGIEDYARIGAGRYHVYIEAPPGIALQLREFILNLSSRAQVTMIFNSSLETSLLSVRTHPLLGELIKEANAVIPGIPLDLKTLYSSSGSYDLKLFLARPKPSAWERAKSAMLRSEPVDASASHMARLRRGRISLRTAPSALPGAQLGEGYLSSGETVEIIEVRDACFYRVKLPDGFVEAWVAAEDIFAPACATSVAAASKNRSPRQREVRIRSAVHAGPSIVRKD